MRVVAAGHLASALVGVSVGLLPAAVAGVVPVPWWLAVAGLVVGVAGLVVGVAGARRARAATPSALERLRRDLVAERGHEVWIVVTSSSADRRS